MAHDSQIVGVKENLKLSHVVKLLLPLYEEA